MYDMTKAIEIVKNHVPEELPTKNVLMARLDWCLNDISYRAPEVQYISWRYFEDALTSYLGTDMSISWLDSMVKTLASEVWDI